MDAKTVQANRQDIQVLDVREDDEWTAGRIDGALHIRLGELERRVSELDRNRPIVTVCRSGGWQGCRVPQRCRPEGRGHGRRDDAVGQGRAALHHS